MDRVERQRETVGQKATERERERESKKGGGVEGKQELSWDRFSF